MSEPIKIGMGEYQISGRRVIASTSAKLDNPPLIVALHGGGFTSSYFDCGEYSLLDRASAAGCPCIAIDRPGYGMSTRLPSGDQALASNAKLLSLVIGQLWKQRDFDASGIVLLGHSAGAGIVNHLSGLALDWPLLGVAFSGSTASIPRDIPPFWEDLPPQEWIRSSFESNLALLFGPPGTYAAGAPELCDKIGVPFWAREAIEMFSVFPTELPEVGARIRVPVHCWLDDLASVRQNAHDQLSIFSKAYPNAPSVKTTFVPRAGHCIDFHLVGKAFQEEQIAFSIDCAARAGADTTQ